MHQRTVTVSTEGRGLYEFTRQVAAVVDDAGLETGLCHLFVQHTSASLTIQENADPDVQHDLDDWFTRHVPEGDARYRHTAEGPDDMPAHIRAALTDTSLTIPVRDGRPALGTWQGIFLFEHRARAHQRRVVITVQG